MGLFLTNEVKSLYVGDKAVVEVYLGSEKIWENENLICTYDIDEPGETIICNSYGNTQSIIVDGVSQDPSNTYNFEEAGEHTVEFVGAGKKIPSAMFSETNVKSVVLPNVVTIIGPNTFSNCLVLMSITIPNSVMSISGSAFSNCVVLTSITCLATTLVVSSNAFDNLPLVGVLKVPAGSNTGLESKVPEGWTIEYI